MRVPLSSIDSLAYAVPELVVCGGAIGLFLLAAAARRPRSWHGWLFPLVSGGAILASLGWLVWFGLESASRPLFSADGQGLVIFSGLVACDPLAVAFRALCLLAAGAGVLLSVGSPSLPKTQRAEYHGLLLVLCAGMCLLASASHLLMIYVALETVSLCSYLLVGWDRSRSRSTEAGLKYVLYGGVASGVMLFGMSLIYGLFGSLDLQGLHQAIAGSDALATAPGRWAALLGFAFVLAGLGYKVAAVPFHMWCPDAYEGAPTPFTALLSVGPKAAGFAVLMRFFWGIFLDGPGVGAATLDADIPWPLLLGVISALTMTLGNLVAIVQDNLKRLLAYSSIAHAGYVLMGVVAGGQDGFESVALYMTVYLFMNIGAFAVVSAVDRSAGSEDIRQYSGLGSRSPWLALLLAIFLFSLTGLPPTAGFIGKLYLFAALIARGGTWYLVLALVGIVNSVISLFYYARVLKAMYLEQPALTEPVKAANAAGVLAFLMAVPTLVFGLFWQPLGVLASWSSRLLH
ncbi:MAG: NADH-quinone oxidoreductase subunit N [Deltaproteobacteria bacterium]|nr:NADH-quinone oxidoreductase subunit N [Deltaproteobacteria bacterium]